MKNSPPAWLYKRPRILNILHAARLVSPHSQMNVIEKDSLRKFATGKQTALEIGTYMGVTANIIAGALAKNGKLFCVDPFEAKANKPNPGFRMAVRELRRRNLFNKVTFLTGFSHEKEIIDQIPANLDFVLVDGDHSYEGLANDWKIILDKLSVNGIVCLHDTTIPESEPYRNFGSVKYFNDIIQNDKNFELLETAYSMNVLKRKQ